MRMIKHFIFILFVVAGMALSVSAQKGGGQDRPPKKDPPPKIEPKPKDRPKDNPKKPGMSYFVSIRTETEYAD